MLIKKEIGQFLQLKTYVKEMIKDLRKKIAQSSPLAPKKIIY